MNTDSQLGLLIAISVWTTVSAALLYLTTHWRQRHFGAQLAYRSWLLLPITALAAGLGHLQPQWTNSPLSLLPVVGNASLQRGAAWVQTQAPNTWSLLFALWLIGAAICLSWLVLQQWRFQSQLRNLLAIGQNRFLAKRNDVGPALIGLFRPKIVLPNDFATRYSSLQQAMIVRHETLHLARGDIWVNALIAVWLVLNWFNPIAYLAASRLRRDQELACDAAVLREFPGSAKTYAEAMLSTQLTVLGLPVGCHWQSSHPIKERLIMLTKPTHSRRQGLFGLLLFGLTAIGLSSIALAGQESATEDEFDVAPSYAQLTPPKYPKSAKDERVSGRVTLKLLIGTDGKVAQAEVVDSPDSRLSEAAEAAVKDWVLVPASKQGEPVPAWVMVPIDFSLDETVPSDASAPTQGNQLDALYVKAG
ncbi:hypothetical protein C7S18_11925 [Ahniella affigens]|uniref:TonB C-terminal domain-containing protein n=1 Tax=Ahniella affigens TaxID=2021234 RepID=A0A2P1PSP2_9GAMM|nr:TonB family protein [Ahniella affigens]AVP97859.1 hypothetical protein C7S18_11925 [Ahniella affigens]